MSQSSLLDEIREFCGPLGPLQTVDEFYSRQNKWATALGPDGIHKLVNILINIPYLRDFTENERQAFPVVIYDALAIACRIYPNETLAIVATLLNDTRSYESVTTVIEALRDTRGLRFLTHIVQQRGVPDEVLMSAADAARVIGGEEASEVIRCVFEYPHDNIKEWMKEVQSRVGSRRP